ncbi:MAG: hypothetical protein QOH75_2503 [Actinomycetota bacterium]|nr:hypothetical protein [Actinomycetota bacterium]
MLPQQWLDPLKLRSVAPHHDRQGSPFDLGDAAGDRGIEHPCARRTNPLSDLDARPGAHAAHVDIHAAGPQSGHDAVRPVGDLLKASFVTMLITTSVVPGPLVVGQLLDRRAGEHARQRFRTHRRGDDHTDPLLLGGGQDFALDLPGVEQIFRLQRLCRCELLNAAVEAVRHRPAGTSSSEQFVTK